MLIHIVKTGDTVEKIVNSYRILKTDLISNNLHITDFSHLKSGMKLKIPFITKDTMEVLEETEAFIDDYYPSFEKFLKDNEIIEEEQIYNKQEKSEKESNIKEEIIDTNEVLNKDVVRISSKNDKPLNKAIYSSQSNFLYKGNLIPNIDSKYIKKI